MRRRRCFSLFFFNDTATTEIYTLSLHDALPISSVLSEWPSTWAFRRAVSTEITMSPKKFLNSPRDRLFQELPLILDRKSTRLNSSHGYISYAVFCLKKKKYKPVPTKH